MPLTWRVAGLDLSIGGPPVASQITALSTSPRASRPAPYPCAGQSSTASPRGHRVNSLTRNIASGSAAWRRAARSLETADAFELPWVRFWRSGRGSRWACGDVVVVAARVLPWVWTANVNRVVAVSRRSRRVAVSWGTTARHVLRGEELVSVEKAQNGDVVFILRSFSRPHAFMAWVMYPMVVYMQHAFARDVCKHLRELANENV